MAVRFAPVPLAATLERMRAQIAEEAAGWEPAIGAFFAAEFPPRLRNAPLFMPPPSWLGAPRRPAGSGSASSPTVLRDALLERHPAAAKARPPDPRAIASSERPRRLTELAERRRALEVAEERLIMSAEAAGLNVDHWADADPAIVLSTTLKAPERRTRRAR